MDTGMPRVSVIIATFNRARMLRCALQSVLQQEFADLEVLVVGDHCTDDSGDVVASMNDRRVQWLNRDVNCGNQSAPNNDGIARARGELIAFLGHDDLWLPWHLETLVSMLDAGADLVHSTLTLLDPKDVRDVFAGPPEGESYETTFVPPSGWLVRKRVLEAVGGWRDHAIISRGTDDDLLRRIARAGHRIERVPRISVIKFPSAWWRAYAADADIPQERWLAAMQRDPRVVEHELLTSAVAVLAAKIPYAGPGRAIARAWQASARWLRNQVEGESGLAARVFRARYHRRRRLMKRDRGL